MSLKKNMYQKTGIFLFSLIFVLLFSVFLNGKYKRSYEIQIFATNISEKIDFNKIKKYGIDKVIIRTFQNKNEGKGLFFKNTLYKVIEPLLDNLIIKRKVAKKIGDYPLLFAWLITRNFNWTKESKLFDYKYLDGKLKQIYKYDLFNPNAVNKILRIYKEIARNDIDGILIQDDLIIKYNEEMTEYALSEFERRTNKTANIEKMVRSNSGYNIEWVNIKKDRINEVLREIVKTVKRINPNLKIGMNLYYETPVFVKRAEQWYAHNLKEILKTGIDYIYLMSYQRQIKDEMNLSERDNKKLFGRIVNEAFGLAGEKLIVKVQLYDWKTRERISKKEALAYLKLIPSGVKRVCFTPVKLKDLKFVKKIIRKSRIKR